MSSNFIIVPRIRTFSYMQKVARKCTAAELVNYVCVLLLLPCVAISAQNSQRQITTNYPTRFVTSDHTFEWWSGHTPLGRVGVWTVTDYAVSPNKKTHVVFLGPAGHLSLGTGLARVSVWPTWCFLVALAVGVLIFVQWRKRRAVKQEKN
jgi:hypothetical protein